MTVIHDIQRGLDSLQPNPFTIRDSLADRGFALILIPYPDAPIRLHQDELSVQIRLAAGRQMFSIFSPLGLIDGALPVPAYENLMRRNYFADQTLGAHYALMTLDANDGLVAAIHWPANAIAPAQFAHLFETLILATFMMLKEVVHMAKDVPQLRPITGG